MRLAADGDQSLTYRKYKNRFHLARGMLRVAFDPIGNMKYRRRTQNEWPVTRRIPVGGQRAGKILLRRAGSCWDQAALTGARRPTQCIGRPRLSWRGSVPKVLRRSHLQLNRGGCEPFFCLRSTNKTAQVRAFERGPSNPKYLMLCRPRSGTCCFRMWISFSFDNRIGTSRLFRVSLAMY